MVGGLFGQKKDIIMPIGKERNFGGVLNSVKLPEEFTFNNKFLKQLTERNKNFDQAVINSADNTAKETLRTFLSIISSKGISKTSTQRKKELSDIAASSRQLSLRLDKKRKDRIVSTLSKLLHMIDNSFGGTSHSLIQIAYNKIGNEPKTQLKTSFLNYIKISLYDLDAEIMVDGKVSKELSKDLSVQLMILSECASKAETFVKNDKYDNQFTIKLIEDLALVWKAYTGLSPHSTYHYKPNYITELPYQNDEIKLFSIWVLQVFDSIKKHYRALNNAIPTLNTIENMLSDLKNGQK